MITLIGGIIIATIPILQSNSYQLALATLLNTDNPDAQDQQDDLLLTQPNHIKDLLPNSTENAPQTEILQDNNTNIGDLIKLQKNESEIKPPLPCPPLCIPKAPNCPPLCAHPETGERVNNPYADAVYREGAAVGGNETDPSNKLASSSCFGNELLVGGGWKSSNPNVIVQSSYAENNQWVVRFHVPDGPVDLKAFALCLKFHSR